MTDSAIVTLNKELNSMLATAIAMLATETTAWNAQGSSASITAGSPVIANTLSYCYELRQAVLDLRTFVFPSTAAASLLNSAVLATDFASKFGIAAGSVSSVLGADGAAAGTASSAGTVPLQAVDLLTALNSFRLFVAVNCPAPNMQSLDPVVAGISVNVGQLLRQMDKVGLLANQIAQGF